MPGGLNDILPDPISEEDEEILLDLVRRKMRGAAGLTVRLLHAMEERFGPEAREVVRELITHGEVAPRRDAGEPEADLRAFCARLDTGCVGSHRWHRVTDEPDRVAYHYTRCMWAEVFRDLGEPELGFVICASDEPAIRAYNPRLAFKRANVFMNGDEICDHVFYMKKG